jgi:pimeloyl-[acyl-carrier protein] methyl ester esterase
MSKQLEVIFQHGWAFDSSSWDKWKSLFSSTSQIKANDRGYFGEQQNHIFEITNSFKIIICHSLGLHLLSKELLESCDLLMIFGGFFHFHPSSTKENRRSKLVLKRMIKQLEKNPESVLQNFYQNVFFPQPYQNQPQIISNFEQLKSDLILLDESYFELENFEGVNQVLIFHGEQDQIVPFTLGKELSIKTNFLLHSFPEEGHALPFTDAQQCWQKALEILDF